MSLQRLLHRSEKQAAEHHFSENLACCSAKKIYRTMGVAKVTAASGGRTSRAAARSFPSASLFTATDDMGSCNQSQKLLHHA
jgi:hypothetical protein